MKKLTNFFNCAANGLPKTGGGTSQTRGHQLGVASVITSTLSRFDYVSLASRLRVFDNIRGISALFSPRVYRYAAVLLMVFMVGIGNAWGDTSYYLQGISGSAGTSSLTGDFYTTAACSQSVSVSYDGISYSKAVTFGGNISSIVSNNYPNRMIRYDCKTTQTDFVIIAYANSNSKILYYGNIKEAAKGSANTATAYSSKTLNNGSITPIEYSISSSTPASLFVSVGSNNNAFVVQIIATEKGDPLPTPGSVGYKVNFNKTRAVARSGAATMLDNNLEIHSNENITAGSTEKIKMQTKGTNYIKFTTATACTAKITINGIGNGFYVADDKGATKNASALQNDGNKTYELEVGEGDHYIVPNGSNMYVEYLELAGGGDTPTTYTVTYNGNGNTSGDEPTDSDSPYTTGSSVTVLGKGTLVKENCVFAGWNTAANGSGTWYDPNASFSMGSSNVTLYAQWAACINTLDFGTIAAGISSPDLAKTQSNLTSNNVKHVIAENTRYDKSSGYQGLKFRNSGDWIGFGVAAGNSVTITTQTVNSSPAVTIDFASAATLSANKNNEYAADNDKARYFRVKAANGDAVVINKITIASSTPACSTPAVPDGLSAGSITSTGATFTITDDESPASYDIYYSTSSTEPIATTGASATTTSNTKEVTGLTANTTYYAWVRAVCDPSHKSDWVALSGGTFSTLPTYTVTYKTTGSDSGSAPSDATNYDSGSAVTVLGNTGSLVKSGYVFAGWNTASTLDGTDYAPGTKFNIGANTNLYPVWAEGTEETITYVVKTSSAASTTPSTHLTNLVNETSVGIADVTDQTKSDRSGKYATSATEGHGVSFMFDVAGGYTFHPTSIAIQLATVNTTDFTFYVTLEDANGTKLTSNALNTFTDDGVLTNVTFPAYDKTFVSGTVTMLVSATRTGGDAGTYRIGKTITIKGAVAEVPAPDPSTKRIYMKCGSTWCDDVDEQAPKFYVYAWAPSEFSAEMTKMCEGNVYYADIPSAIETVLFTRQKAASIGLDWNDNFVNQSEDITLGSNDLFTCTGWNSETHAKATFSTGTYAAPTFTVTYNKNGDGAGNDGAVTGNVPTDATAYACGANVTVSGNTGNMALAGYSFAGWNTAANGTGTAKAADATYEISGNTTFYAQWQQEVPTSVTVDGGWRYFPGQTISLTATPTGGTSDFTYQWQKYVTNDWQDIDGEDGATYSKTNCTISDCGSYRCIVSKLGGSVESNAFDVHIYTLNGNYDGSDWVSNNLTFVSGTSGKVELSLEAGRLYEFKVKDNFANYWFGNSGYMLKSESNWACPKDGADIRVFTGAEGTYTFTVDIAHVDYGTPQVEVSVTYPDVTHPVAGYIYYTKGDITWENVAVHWWNWENETATDFIAWANNPWLTEEQSVTICGTKYYYMPKFEGYNRVIFHNAGGEGQTSDITVDASSSGKYIAGNSTEWTAFPVYTVTFNSNGGSAVAEQEVPCGGNASEPTAPTRLNYDFEGWQLAGVDYNFAAVVDEDITLDAVWTRKAIPGSEEDITIIDGTTVNTGGTLSVGHYFSAGTEDNHVKYAGAMKGTGCRFTTFTIPSGKTGIVKEATVYTAKTFVIIPASDISGIDFENNTSAGATVTYDNAYFSLTGASGGKSQGEATKNDEMSAGTYYCGSTGSGLQIGKLTLTITTSAPTVKLKVLGSVTQTITITVGEKLGEIFASGSLPTPSLPVGYTFKGWKNEANDAAVDNNTVTTGSMVIYADVDAPISTDATLSALTVNGDAATVDPSDATQYTFTLPFGTTAAPTVVATPTDANAVATVTANTLSGATIEVVPESGEGDKVTYTITYSIESSKDIRMVWKKTGNPCGESSAPTAFVLSTDDAIKDYLSISFVQTTEDNSKKAEEKSDGYLSTGKSVGNLVKITAKPGYAFKNMSFYGKIETDEIQCPVSIDGGETWTPISSTSGSDAQYCDIFTNAEVHEIILKNNAGYGTWLRHMDLTMIQACTPKTIAWTAEPASEYEVGKAGYAIAASANNGTVTYAASNAAITVNESTGALTINSLTNDIDLSASVPVGDGTLYCATPASVVKEEIKTYYLVTFDAQNETAATPVKYYSGDAAIALPSPSYSGYVFQGWFDAAEGGNQITGATITPTASRTVYAQWLAECAGPTITTQPASASYFVGRTATALSCEATAGAAGELTYTWYSCDDAERTNPVALEGAPTPSTAEAGIQYYYFTVTEAGCDVVRTSDVATITVTEKDQLLLIKIATTGGSNKTVTGYCAKAADCAVSLQTDSKFGSNSYMKMALDDEEFQAGDIFNVHITTLANQGTISLYSTNGSDEALLYNSGVLGVVGNNRIPLTSAIEDYSTLFLCRTSGNSWNPYVDFIEVYRPYPVPVLKAMTINGSAATIAGTNITAVIAANAELASLTIDPTFMSNDPTQTNGDLGEWSEVSEGVYSASYVVTDKDDDTNTYTITLTRDVEIASVTISGETSVAAESQITLTATVLPNNVINKAVVWSSSDETKAEVDENGVVTGKAAGVVTITATAVADNTKYGTYDITVTPFIGSKYAYWFTKESDIPEDLANDDGTIFEDAPSSGSNTNASMTVEINGVERTFNLTGRSGDGSFGTFHVPAGFTADLYVLAVGSGSPRTLKLQETTTSAVYKSTPDEFGSDAVKLVFSNVATGNYTFDKGGQNSRVFMMVAELNSYPLSEISLADMTLRTAQSGTPAITLTHAKATITSQTWSIIENNAEGTTINASTGVITAGTTPGTITVQVVAEDAMGNEVTSNICTVTIVNIFEREDVTGSMTWNWNNAGNTENVEVATASGLALANYISGDAWKYISGTNGDYAYNTNNSGSYQGYGSLSFRTTVPGLVKITGKRISSNAVITINGAVTAGTLGESVATLNAICVAAGEVTITPDSKGMRITKIEFDADLVPADAEESFLGGYERTVDPKYYGTICVPKAGVMTGATLFQVAYMDYKDDKPYKVYYDEVENGTMQAGMPYIFLAEQSTIGVYYTGTAEETAKDHNGLHGTLEDITSGMNATGIYMFYNNRVVHSTNAASNLPANRAYLQISEIQGYGNPNYQAPAPTRRRISTGFNGANSATGLENMQVSEGRVQKVLIDGKIYILRGEKIFDATGRLVK